tara:strand:+ start:692 stop:1420 length:729 start_codon:yes stop_codon:yes gene_type:complete
MSYQLLTTNNPKTLKGFKKYKNILTAIMHLRPISTQICPYQDIAKCKAACLNTAGRGGIFKKGENTNRIQDARQRRTDMYLNHYDYFMELLHTELTKFKNYCEKKDITPAFRLNGTSDIQWEHKLYKGKTMFEHFPDVQFYDYTKIPTRKVSHIPNYHLTWSYSEANEKYATWFDKLTYNIAVVFNGDMPLIFKGMKVVNGDETDIRFLDESNVVVGLKAKGKAKQDKGGFVIHTNNLIASS